MRVHPTTNGKRTSCPTTSVGARHSMSLSAASSLAAAAAAACAGTRLQLKQEATELCDREIHLILLHNSSGCFAQHAGWDGPDSVYGARI